MRFISSLAWMRYWLQHSDGASVECREDHEELEGLGIQNLNFLRFFQVQS